MGQAREIEETDNNPLELTHASVIAVVLSPVLVKERFNPGYCFTDEI